MARGNEGIGSAGRGRETETEQQEGGGGINISIQYLQDAKQRFYNWKECSP